MVKNENKCANCGCSLLLDETKNLGRCLDCLKKELQEECEWETFEEGYNEGYESGVEDFAEVEYRKALLRAKGLRIIGDPIELTRKQKIAKILIQAGAGFVLWTVILTPYIYPFVALTVPNYLNWLLMEAILVPPVAVVVVKATNWLTKKLGL